MAGHRAVRGADSQRHDLFDQRLAVAPLFGAGLGLEKKGIVALA
jgi:hypothetical protein